MSSLKRGAQNLPYASNIVRPHLLHFHYSSLYHFLKHYFSNILQYFSSFGTLMQAAILPECLISSFFAELLPSHFSGLIFSVTSSRNFPVILSKSCLRQYSHVNLFCFVFYNTKDILNFTCFYVVHTSLLRLRAPGGSSSVLFAAIFSIWSIIFNT